MMAPFSAWWLLACVLPVLLAGELLFRRVALFSRFNIPVPVIGGLTFCLAVLALNLSGLSSLAFATTVDARWWTWLVSAEPEWSRDPVRALNLPFLVGFFTCIGLNATWQLVRAGSWPLVVFLGVATLLAIVQNFVGVGLAVLLGAPPLLGVVCGAVTLTGGHGTALGFAPTLAQAGFAAAGVAGVAAATFGLVTGGLTGGPVATWLINRRKLPTPSVATDLAAASRGNSAGVLAAWRGFFQLGSPALVHLFWLAACLKGGAWLSYFLRQAGLTFPAYMGAMICGLVLRNLHDAFGATFLRADIINRLGSLLLGVFLALTMSSLNLRDLSGVAGPMLIILGAQVAVMIVFAIAITWPLLGRDYEAAVIAAGHVGFGLGSTATAVANMDSLVRRYGPAPRAYTIVPPTGAFLIDLTNAVVITVSINLLR